MRTFTDARGLADLDRRYSTLQLVDQRRRVREIVAARAGETGLDVGCGPGFLACELAAEVSPEGCIVAIDMSSHSVDATAARAEKRGLAGVAKVQVGDAANLDFPDNTFDFVVATQVYCYVSDAGRAIETRYDPDSFGIESIEGTCDAALADGNPAADVAAWEQDLRARQADGEWFFCLNRFIFTATK